LSPVPTQTTLALDGATATAPTEVMPTESVTGSQVVPALVVRQTPPVRAPANMTSRCALAGDSGTARQETHAPVRHGPRLRKVKLLSRPLRPESAEKAVAARPMAANMRASFFVRTHLRVNVRCYYDTRRAILKAHT